MNYAKRLARSIFREHYIMNGMLILSSDIEILTEQIIYTCRFSLDELFRPVGHATLRVSDVMGKLTT